MYCTCMDSILVLLYFSPQYLNVLRNLIHLVFIIYLVRTLLHVFWYYHITLLQIHYRIEWFTILIKTPFRISFIDCKLCSKIGHQNHNCACICECKLVIVCVNQSKNDKQDKMINKKFSEYRYLGKVIGFFYNFFFRNNWNTVICDLQVIYLNQPPLYLWKSSYKPCKIPPFL